MMNITSSGSFNPRSAAMAELISQREAFLGFLQRRVEDREIAEDLLQKAFLHGMDRLDQVRSQGSVTSWFYQLLRNELNQYWRSRRAERRMIDRMTREAGDAVVPAPEPQGVLCRCVQSELAELRPEYREIILRVDVEGMRPVDLAAEWGISPNSLSVRLHRARRALRDRLLDVCGTCAGQACLDCACEHASADCKENDARASTQLIGERSAADPVSRERQWQKGAER